MTTGDRITVLITALLIAATGLSVATFYYSDRLETTNSRIYALSDQSQFTDNEVFTLRAEIAALTFEVRQLQARIITLENKMQELAPDAPAE